MSVRTAYYLRVAPARVAVPGVLAESETISSRIRFASFKVMSSEVFVSSVAAASSGSEDCLEDEVPGVAALWDPDVT